MDLPDVVADVVVLAGDIDRGIKGVFWARHAFPNVAVLYVAHLRFAAACSWQAIERRLP